MEPNPPQPNYPQPTGQIPSMAPVPNIPPHKKGFPVWPTALIALIAFVALVAGLALTALPLIATNTREARRSEAYGLLSYLVPIVLDHGFNYGAYPTNFTSPPEHGGCLLDLGVLSGVYFEVPDQVFPADNDQVTIVANPVEYLNDGTAHQTLGLFTVTQDVVWK